MKQFLKELGLQEDILTKILVKHNSDLETMKKSKDELEKSLELSKQEISTRDKQLKELSKIDVEELNSKIKAFEEENKVLVDKHNKEMAQVKTDYAIEKALTQAGARNIKAAKSLLDIDGLKLNKDGTLSGLDEQVQKLVNDENSSFMFNIDTSNIKGLTPSSSSPQPVTKSVNDMNYAELCEYIDNGGTL